MLNYLKLFGWVGWRLSFIALQSIWIISNPSAEHIFSDFEVWHNYIWMRSHVQEESRRWWTENFQCECNQDNEVLFMNVANHIVECILHCTFYDCIQKCTNGACIFIPMKRWLHIFTFRKFTYSHFNYILCFCFSASSFVHNMMQFRAM